MKRGLVEVADRPVYEARLERLQEQLRERGIAAALIYGDVYRSDDIAHLTNLCIYWNEGVIAVPADRPPALLAKLSKRVHPWMQRTSILEDLRASQNLPKLISEYLGELPAGAVAFIEAVWWPERLLRDISAAIDGRETLMLDDEVRRTRLVVDDADRADLVRAGEIVTAGLLAAEKAGADAEPAQRVAAVELATRREGARDVLAFCESVEAGATPLELTVQYANVWAYAARTPNLDAEVARSLRAAYGAAQEALVPGASAAELAERARAVADDLAVELSLTHHCDLGTAGDYRGADDDAKPLPAGAVVALQLRAPRSGGGSAVLADTFLMTDAGAAALTGATARVAA